jgi:hypothetical protein
MTRSYRPRSKGENPDSYQKHELVKDIVDAQIAVAGNFLRRQHSALIVDLHAGDGHGVEPAQGHLFGPQESIPTPLVALDAAMRLGSRCRVSLRLFELDLARHTTLQCEIARRNPQLAAISIERDHRGLSQFSFFRDYDYVLVISDPNGPRAAGADVLEEIALQRAGRRLDVVAVINVGALRRMANVHAPDPASRAARAKYEQSYWWHDKPEEWARRLDRQYVVATPEAARLGHGAMQGRIFLVTNFAAKPPRGFRLVFDAGNGQPSIDRRQSAPPAPRQSPSLPA